MLRLNIISQPKSSQIITPTVSTQMPIDDKISNKTPTKRRNESQLLSFDKIQKRYSDKNCILLSNKEDYTGVNSLLKYKCCCGNPNAIKSYSNFKKTPNCRNIAYNCKPFSALEREKLRYEERKNFYLQHGCQLISTKYIKTSDLLEYICSCGKNDIKTYSAFKTTPRCGEGDCAKYTVTDIENKYYEHGCILLDKITSILRRNEYSFICHCGEEDNKKFTNFEINPQCSGCDKLDYLHRIELKYIERGAKLLSRQAVLDGTLKQDDPTPLNFICVCGNDECSKHLNAFLTTPHCDKCTDKIRHQNQFDKKISYNSVRDYFESIGYKLLLEEKDFKGVYNCKFPALCPKNHECKIRYYLAKRGGLPCKICRSSPEFVDAKTKKWKETLKERYGEESILKIEQFKQKCITTFLERYGEKSPMEIEEFRQKRALTCLGRYGNESPMRNAEVYSKYKQSCLSHKEYILPSGNKILYQGYEHFCLDDLLKDEGYKEEEIVNQIIMEEGKKIHNKIIPTIWYEYKGKTCRYYCDFFIPHENKIIEVKSEYTLDVDFERNKAKALACKEAGYIFELRVYNEKGIWLTKYNDATFNI